MTLPNLIKCCIFDFDGTLVDTMGGFADIAADVIERHYGIDFEQGRLKYLETSGIPFFQQLEIICPNGDKNNICADEFESRKLEGFFDSAPTDETIAGLTMLRRADLRLIVSSNNFQENVDSYLKKYPLPLDLALGFDNHWLEKGRPHFEKAQELFGMKPDQTVFCGDSLEDGVRAKDCGLFFVGMLGTFTREQFNKKFPECLTVKSILQLAELVVESIR
ncbi:MAG: HAD hydrolase-like protein [Deltaproteobacteria bacterium]|nr:HAD hydrolase-like protein [Deltaproteobacteria bacterium]